MRFKSLDALRGVAALVVVVHHCLLASSTFAEPYRTNHPDQPWWAFALTYTPAHLVWAGGEAVLLFFVLSGFVLALPVLKSGVRAYRWVAYYPKRLVRLYLPVWGSVAVAVMAHVMLSGWVIPGRSFVTAAQSADLTTNAVLREVLLVFGTNWLNQPLWSLRWEVIFSLLLPLYVAVALALRRVARLACVLVVLLVGLSVYLTLPITYLLIFAFGVLLAVRRNEVVLWSRQLRGGKAAAVSVTALIGLTLGWTVNAPAWIGQPIAAASAVALVVVCAGQPTAVAVLTRPTAQWLGTRSFSLYLTHYPVLLATGYLLHTASAGLVLVVGLPASLAVADLFYRLVEGPSHRLSQAVGRTLEQWAANRGRRNTLAVEQNRGLHSGPGANSDLRD